MKNLILLFSIVITLSVFSVSCFTQWNYKHKSEDEIAAMTPAERVEEMVKEDYYHGVDHDQRSMLRGYFLKDGEKALPALADIANNHNPDQPLGYETNKMLLAFYWMSQIDDLVIRISGTEEGPDAIKAFEGVVDRMKKAGYGNRKHKLHRKYVTYLSFLRAFKGLEINLADEHIQAALSENHEIQISKEEMIRFSDYLTSHDPTYPSRCKPRFPPPSMPCKDSKEYYDAYIRFKAEVRFSGFCANTTGMSQFDAVDKLASFAEDGEDEFDLAKKRFYSFSDKIQVNIYLIGELCKRGRYFSTSIVIPGRFVRIGEELLILRREEAIGGISTRIAETQYWNVLNSLSQLLVQIDKDCKCVGKNPVLSSALKKVFDEPPKISDRFDEDNYDRFLSNISRLNIEDVLIKSKLGSK